MNIYPSLYRLPEGEELKIENVGNGLYAITNAYSGDYDYFGERPSFVKQENR